MEGRVMRDAGIVNQDVQAAVGAHDAFDRHVDRCLASDVEHKRFNGKPA
jgi:hypothetical protein